ncbi:MAG: cellulase family glycosylhydrolase [Armatimonadota bacterium]
MKLYVAAVLVLYQMIGIASSGSTATLGISEDGSQFTINKKAIFMTGISYYGAMSIETPSFVKKDLDDMKRDGFNWIRVWMNWNPTDINVSVVTPDGELRKPYISRLKYLIRECNRRGMIVDVTFTRGADPFPSNQTQHLECVKTFAKELKPYRNLYIDVGNERDVGDARYVSYEDMGALISAIKEIDPKRICTASGVPSSPEDLAKYINIGKCDFLAPHLGRDRESPSETKGKVQEFIGWMGKDNIKRVPILLQEPFRRDYGSYQPVESDYYTDAIGGKQGGAAGWCLHNGSNRANTRFRSFRMTDKDGRLYDQLDEVELAVTHNIAKKLGLLSAMDDED